ncbi:hypothetical protein LAJ19_16385 (plasmid) [Deinococcus taeanensis]|uniref:TlpA family protein disulfide reductase n=1 Tax=Deinococcus taeanensis TaxID=2737050 RepID=UPI001CDB7D64|nr:hypothetical protein [Deinococcus taeanensis]UBV44734.1 hypothetical protein LAJ19_16385 [Deinococcus taeanensis]
MQIKVPQWLGQFIEKRLAARLPRRGDQVTPCKQLRLTRRTLLYFKAEQCVACGTVEMYIGQLAAANNLDLRVIDFRRGELPEAVYGGQLLLDQTREIGRRYRVFSFPTLVITDEHGVIEGAIAGGAVDRADVSARLGLQA